MSFWALPWVVTLLAILATYFWRALGAGLALRIDPGSAAFRWVSCVSFAMVAGLISRMTIFPLGALEAIPPTDRVGAMALAFVAFFLWRRQSILGPVVIGVASFIALIYLRAGFLAPS